MYRYLGVLAVAALTVGGCKNKDKENGGNGKKEIVYSDVLRQQLDLLHSYPDSNGLRFNIAIGLDSAGDYKNALAQMDSLIARDSLNYGFHFTKGQIAQDAGDTVLAIAHMEKAMKIYPAPEGLMALANLYAEKKNPKALYILQYLQKRSLDRQTAANRDFIAGVYYARIGDMDDALKHLDNSIAQDYTNMPVYIEKGLLYFDRKQYRQALQVFRTAAEVNRLYPDAYYYLARSYEKMGIRDSAVLFFRQALLLDDTIAEARDGLKRLHAE